MAEPQNRKRATILDIAHKAGVTDGTVSRALAGDKRVRPETRDRIVIAARELGYVPNLAARAFKRGRAGSLGVLCEPGSWIFFNPYFGRLLSGLVEAAGANDQPLVVYPPQVEKPAPDNNPEHENRRIRGWEALQDGRVDAAVVLGGRGANAQELERLGQFTIPIVLLGNNEIVPNFFQMGSGARQKAYEAARRIWKETGKAPAFLGLYEGGNFNSVSQAGLEQAAKEAGHPGGCGLFVPVLVEDFAAPEVILDAIKRVQASGADTLICADFHQALEVQRLVSEGILKLDRNLDLVSFGPQVLAVQKTGPVKMRILDCDLIEAGRRAYALVQEAADRRPPRTEELNWKWIEN